MNIEQVDILGVKVSAVNPSIAVRFIRQMIMDRSKAYVCVAPVSTLVDAQRIAGYKEIINKADMVTPDGAPVAWLCRLKGAREVTRTYGPDLMRNLCAQEGLRHFFYGSTPDVLDKLQLSLKEINPSIVIAGVYAPSFSPHAKVESFQIIDMINASRADICWVGLGSPKQDQWMSLHRHLLDVPVLIGIGAAFDFIAGTKPQAPRWMQRCALEWCFRLCSEPRRLWRRYLIGNSLFIYYLIKDFFKKHDDAA